MYTQINCPQCGTPFTAEIHQVVDSRHTPELKQRLLDGTLNLAICPQCGAGGQLSTILLFHDPEHELFMIHVPNELNLNQVEREQTIGRLTQDVMNNLPPEERRAYMLQPQMMLNMKTFMEKVLETEGITKEMIERQQKQVELLQTLARADKDVQDYLIQERSDEIDEAFFAILQSFVDQASQLNDDQQLLPLINLRARLMTETVVGQQIERRQTAVHKLSQEAKQQNGLTPALLARHVVANQESEDVVDALVMAGQGALRYEFFSELTAEIDKAGKAGDQASAQRLEALRDKYLDLFDQIQEASRQALEEASATLNSILAAPDRARAVMQNIDRIDDAFMYFLTARMQEAEQSGNAAESQALNEIQAIIVGLVEQQMPPEVQLINDLVRAESSEQQQQILDENQQLISPDLVRLLDQVIEQAEQSSEQNLDGRLHNVRAAIEARL